MSRDDGKTILFRMLRAMPANRFGFSLMNRIGRMERVTLSEGIEARVEHVQRRCGNGGIRTRILRPAARDEALPLVVHFHGGGHAMGWPEGAQATHLRMLAARDCVIVSPDYRLTLEAPHPMGHDDCFDVLRWAVGNAQALGGDPAKVVLAGESAGGALALAMAVRARDAGIAIAFQMPLYPMLDDREVNWTPVERGQASWRRRHNRAAWRLLLAGAKDVPADAAPARLTDLAGLAPVLNVIGDRDIFLNENRVFMERLSQAGVPVTFEVFEGAYHAQESLAPDSRLGRQIGDYLAQGFAGHIDKYCG